ncbi:unnamed protein product [Effrenium voratum]|uniref:Uncharacterized protein n=1 Tax=Effrenium voratum TaxID=2562239 RepID=A0AA36NMJ0_9DINO|nr:unnamed protein product [Effrenium voratum]
MTARRVLFMDDFHAAAKALAWLLAIRSVADSIPPPPGAGALFRWSGLARLAPAPRPFLELETTDVWKILAAMVKGNNLRPDLPWVCLMSCRSGLCLYFQRAFSEHSGSLAVRKSVDQTMQRVEQMLQSLVGSKNARRGRSRTPRHTGTSDREGGAPRPGGHGNGDDEWHLVHSPDHGDADTEEAIAWTMKQRGDN